MKRSNISSNRLRKELLFSLADRLELLLCFRCNEKICNVAQLSIEHKVPWEGAINEEELFYDLENVAFSHLSCNSGAARKPTQKYSSKEERRKAHYKLARSRRKGSWHDYRKRDRTGRALGERVGTALLNEKEVSQIKKLLLQGFKNRDLGSIFGVHEETVGLIKRGKSWKHVNGMVA